MVEGIADPQTEVPVASGTEQDKAKAIAGPLEQETWKEHFHRNELYLVL